MHRIAVFLGTRPEAIKLAPVIQALDEAPDMQPVVISTGQHREMLAQVVELFGIGVDHDLQVMQPDQSLAGLSARLLSAIDALLDEHQFDMALVQGDTTTVLMAALCCFYRRIPLGHVEAGLRTGNIWSPFPEEANRKLASTLTALHFAPTERSRQNLLDEHVQDNRIFVTGNTVIDALHLEIKRQQNASVRAHIDDHLAGLLGPEWRKQPFVLVTGHRRENFGGGFDQICQALRTLADRFPDCRFVYPVHLNPRVQGPVHQELAECPNIQLIRPLEYQYFVALIEASRLVLTDSGGVQEEAPSLGKPVLVMRDTTERPEGVEAGTVRLVGADCTSIVEWVSRLLSEADAYQAMAEAVNPYGDGRAASRIVAAVRDFFAKSA